MLNLSDALFILSFLIQFMSVCGLEGCCTIRLSARVEYPCVDKCFLESHTPKTEHGLVQMSIVSGVC